MDQDSVPIEDSDTGDRLFEKLVELCAKMMPQVLERVAWGDAGEPQKEEAMSYAPFFEQAYRQVDWRKPARAVHVQVRACDMGSWGGREGQALALLEGKLVQLRSTRLGLYPLDLKGSPGTVLTRHGDELLVQCGDGALWVRL